MDKALIFGGNGFLGSFIVKELCERNYEVLIASRTEGNFESLKTLGFPGQVVFKHFDVSNLSPLSTFDLNEFSVVINLVGIGAEKGKNSYHDIHVEFASRLAGAVKKTQAQLVHISAFTGEESIKSKYIQTKRKGEKLTLNNNPQAIIIRPSVIIGEGGSLIQTFESIINNAPFVPLPQCGKTKMQPIFAGDVAKFIVLSLKEPKMKGKCFNLCGPQTILFKDFIERICGFMNKKKMLIPVPFFFISSILKVKEFLPSFIFRTSLTRDIFALSKHNLLIEQNDLTLLIKNPTKLDDVLKETLSKYRLYD